MPASQRTERWVPVAEASRMLGINRDAVLRLATTGQIAPVVEPGRSIKIDRASLMAYLEKDGAVLVQK